MKISKSQFTLGLIAAAVISLTACGGGGSADITGNTTPVTTTVMDGLISNALVCVDSNNNGVCDPTETQGRTDANGKVTLDIPSAGVASAKLVAMVGTDATDMDFPTTHVPTAYVLRTPAGKHSVISPLTDMVQTKLDLDSTKTFEAAQSEVKAQLGLDTKVSVTDNFVAQRDGDASYKKASDRAREHVLEIQKSKDELSKLSCANQEGDKSVDQRVREALASQPSSATADLENDSDVKAACNATSTPNTDCDEVKKTKIKPVITSCATPIPTPTPTPTPAPTPTPTPTSTSAVNGKALYAANSCGGCHGTPPSSMKVLNGANSPSTISSAISGIGQMNSYIGKFSTQNLSDIAAYLATPNI